MSQHGRLLFTVLGLDPKPARYTLGGQSVEATLAPLALIKLLAPEERPEQILALCTTDAKKQSWPMLENGLDGSGIELIDAAITPEAETDIPSFLRTVSRTIPVDDPPAMLIIDVTHGLRHLMLLALLAVEYIATLRGVALSGAYYGLWRPVEVGTSPFLNLQPLLELPEWIHALRVFNDSGDASPLALLVKGAGENSARDTAKDLRYISEARLAGLPLELGRLGSEFRKSRRKPFKQALRVGGALLEDELWNRLDEQLARFSFDESATGRDWKKRVVLTAEELVRQAAHVDDLLEHGSIAVALGLMNEWMVSWTALRMDQGSSWLDYHSGRTFAATALSSLDAMASDEELCGKLTEEQRAVGRFWRDLCDLRNGFHHHGMRPQILVGPSVGNLQSKLDAVLTHWEKLKSAPDIPMASPATGHLLVSPIGLRPGVLFSAVEACRRNGASPDACLVLCSNESSGAIDTALQRAGLHGGVQRLCIDDPYGGQSEMDRLVRGARRHLLGAQKVLVNITGGTTLMGLTVSAIADEAQRLAREVRRFGLVDRRPPADQDADPYRAGEALWLDQRGTGYGH